MTAHPQHLRLTTVDTVDSLRVEVHGDLDYDSSQASF